MRNNFGSLVPFAQIVDDLFSKTFTDFNGGSLLKPQVPAINVLEREKEYKIELAAPGLQKSDFKIQMENHSLKISVEKKQEQSEEKENYTRREFSFRSFSRSFELPQNVHAEQISANYENGVLNVILPKRVESNQNAKTIEIA